MSPELVWARTRPDCAPPEHPVHPHKLAVEVGLGDQDAQVRAQPVEPAVYQLRHRDDDLLGGRRQALCEDIQPAPVPRDPEKALGPAAARLGALDVPSTLCDRRGPARRRHELDRHAGPPQALPAEADRRTGP